MKIKRKQIPYEKIREKLRKCNTMKRKQITETKRKLNKTEKNKINETIINDKHIK